MLCQTDFGLLMAARLQEYHWWNKVRRTNKGRMWQGRWIARGRPSNRRRRRAAGRTFLIGLNVRTRELMIKSVTSYTGVLHLEMPSSCTYGCHNSASKGNHT